MSKAVEDYTAIDLEAGATALGARSSGVTTRYNLGTAAGADVTTSATDTTAGRVMRTDDVTDRGVPAESGGELPSQFDSPTFIIKDSLRASVEASSGGRCTVLYDDLDQPSYMVRIPKFMREDIHADFGTGVHPAFIVDGVEKPEIWIGMHHARVYNSRALSLPGLDPSVSMNWDQANTYCTNKGVGWHLMTNWEWAAVTLWVMKQIADGVIPGQPRGNTNYGRAHDEYQETGTQRANGTIGSADRILTGSGPLTWRHDLSSFGISDMVGNVWDWVGGFKIVDGAIKMPNDNDYNLADTSWPDQSAAMTTNGTWNTDRTSGGDTALLMAALIKPATAVTNSTNGYCWITGTGERIPLRGGNWGLGSDAGLGALNLHNVRSSVYTHLGFRHCYIG